MSVQWCGLLYSKTMTLLADSPIDAVARGLAGYPATRRGARLAGGFLLCLAMTLWAPSSTAETYVLHPDGSGDFPTIQAALDTAVDGDVIELTAGDYRGDGNRDIDFLGKAVTIRSQTSDPAVCVIDCQGSAETPHRAFNFDSGEGPASVLQGLTIRNGYADGPD